MRCSFGRKGGEGGGDTVDDDDIRFISGFLAMKIIAEYNWWKIEK